MEEERFYHQREDPFVGNARRLSQFLTERVGGREVGPSVRTDELSLQMGVIWTFCS